MNIKLENPNLKIPGISQNSYRDQISILKDEKKIDKLALHKPCKINDGIIPIDYFNDLESYSIGDQESSCSFIPASGSATRMFNIESHEEYFIKNIKKLPFFNIIKEDYMQKKKGIIDSLKQKDFKKFNTIYFQILQKFINLPKAILPLHKINDFHISPIEEIVFLNSLLSKNRKIYLTIPSGYQDKIYKNLNESEFLKINKINFEDNLDFSFQSIKTNSICLLNNNELLKSSDGNIYTHPSGHGALLENINNIKEKFFYIHNIDNICPNNFSRRILNIKKMNKIISFIKLNFDKILNNCLKNDSKSIESDNFYNTFIKNFLPNIYKQNLDSNDIQSLAIKLNRPLRVCGFIQDKNSKGGKPFWVKDKNDISLQIVEESQIDLNDSSHKKLWNQSIFFNPVEMVCCNRDFNDNKFNLLNFSNQRQHMIVNKKIFGQEVRFIEKPGLWNGSMYNWNSVFIEIEPESFTPVKNICDLFLDIHQP